MKAIFLLVMMIAALSHGSRAFAKEVVIPFHGKISEHQAKGRLPGTVDQETFVVAFAQEIVSRRKEHLREIGRYEHDGGWGHFSRVQFPGVRNYVLTALTLSINGKKLMIPPEQLTGFYNPKFYRLGIVRDRDKHTISIGLEGGGSDQYYWGVDFCFENGQYTKRVMSYLEDSQDGITERAREEIYHGQPAHN